MNIAMLLSYVAVDVAPCMYSAIFARAGATAAADADDADVDVYVDVDGEGTDGRMGAA